MMPSQTSQSSGKLQGKHVLFACLAFFGVIFTVNGVFLYSALSTYTGVVAQEPYRKGLQYNDRIAAGERQNQLGWNNDVILTPDTLSITLTNAEGRPVSGLRITGTLGRPSTNQHDTSLQFSETQPGTYTAPFETLEPGAWLAGFDAIWPHSEAREPVYRARKRLWLKS